jgi:hypothetical protein
MACLPSCGTKLSKLGRIGNFMELYIIGAERCRQNDFR